MESFTFLFTIILVMRILSTLRATEIPNEENPHVRNHAHETRLAK